MASKSPTKKLTRIVSRGDLTAKQALNILSEIQLEEYNKEQENLGHKKLCINFYYTFAER